MKSKIGKIAAMLDKEMVAQIEADKPPQPDEFTLREFMDEFQTTKAIARKAILGMIRDGKLVERYFGRTKLYRKP